MKMISSISFVFWYFFFFFFFSLLPYPSVSACFFFLNCICRFNFLCSSTAMMCTVRSLMYVYLMICMWMCVRHTITQLFHYNCVANSIFLFDVHDSNFDGNVNSSSIFIFYSVAFLSFDSFIVKSISRFFSHTLSVLVYLLMISSIISSQLRQWRSLRFVCVCVCVVHSAVTTQLSLYSGKHTKSQNFITQFDSCTLVPIILFLSELQSSLDTTCSSIYALFHSLTHLISYVLQVIFTSVIWRIVVAVVALSLPAIWKVDLSPHIISNRSFDG